MMSGQSVCGFRDSAYLYYPLFKWIDAQWLAGEIPLWNPFCNYGMPVVADGTSSVFYPGKLIFFCRFLSYASRYGIYLAIHIPIAAAGTYWLARTLRATQAGATLAAFSFAFGGMVLFQVTNVIYLVSAAWLPFAVCCVWKMVKTRQRRWAVAAGVCCALMILGGDPQMVYHVGLIAIGTIAFEMLRRRRRRFRAKHGIVDNHFKWKLVAGLNLGTMIAVTSLLAAIQLLPTYYWSQASERTNPVVPANLYMTFMGDQNEIEINENSLRALIEEPRFTVDHSYQFSQPPWSLAELVWPNISGKPFPRNQRWTNGLPGADRVWVPSLYLGLLPLLLCLTGLRLWGQKRKQVWLTYLLLFFLLGSFGWYGIVWLINEFLPLNNQLPVVGAQVGGLYWIMNMVLPKYFAFRYPAKLFTIAALAIAVLAGVNLKLTRLSAIKYLAGLVGLASLIGYVLLGQLDFKPPFALRPNVLFGPFDFDGAVSSLNTTLIHTGIVGGILTVVAFVSFRNQNRKSNRQKRGYILMFGIVVLSILETLFANHWLVPQVATSVFESPVAVQAKLKELKAEHDSVSPLKIYRSLNEAFERRSWQMKGSNDRLAEVVTWQRETLYPKQHLGEGVILLGSFSSISPEANDWYLSQCELGRIAFKPKYGKYFDHFFDIDIRLSKTALKKFKDEPSFDATPTVMWMFELEPDRQGFQPHDGLIGAAPGMLPTAIRPEWIPAATEAQKTRFAAESKCEMVEFSPNRFTAHVSCNRPLLLGFPCAVQHGWNVKITNRNTGEVSKPTTLAIRDWVLRYPKYFGNGILVPFQDAGDFDVEFVYSPVEFWIGVWISGVGWVLMLIGTIWFWRK
jgi:hypothetical protein